MQAFAIERNSVEVVQARIGYRRDTVVVHELKKFHLAGFGKTKVAEAFLQILYSVLSTPEGNEQDHCQAARFIGRVFEKPATFGTRRADKVE